MAKIITFESISRGLTRTKTVVRRYQTKKGLKVKVYRYEKLDTIVYQNGQFNNRAIVALVSRIRRITNETERRKYLNEVSAIVKQVKGGKLPNFSGKLTLGGILGRISANKAYNYLTTNGFDIGAVCNEYNISANDLLDENNWDGDVWSGQTIKGENLQLEFEHNYNTESDIKVIS